MNTSAVFTAVRRSEQKSQSLAQRGCQSMVLIYLFFFIRVCACVKTAFVFLKQQSLYDSFMRTQVQTPLIMVMNETKKKL